MLVFCCLIGAAGAATQPFWQGAPPLSKNLFVSGNIEIIDTEVSFKIPGRVDERFVSEGDIVKTGDLVARLDASDIEQEVALRESDVAVAGASLAELEAGSRPEEIAQAEAVLNRNQAQLDELLSGSRPQEIVSAEGTLKRAKADVEQAKKDFDRQSMLRQNNAIADREFERAQALFDNAKARAQEAEANLKLVKEGPRRERIEQAKRACEEAKQRFDLVKSGPRKETIATARARVFQASQTLGLSLIKLREAALKSPLSGIVVSQNIEPGEYVSPGTPVVTVAKLDPIWLRAFINETDLEKVKIGQEVKVTTDSNSGKIYSGKVTYISSQAEFTPKTVQTPRERTKLVFRIRIDIPNPLQELKAGMPVDAEIIIK